MLFATFALTGLGLIVAVGLGIFSATPNNGTVSEQLIEAAATESGDISLGENAKALESSKDAQVVLGADAAAFEELKLQEVRDAYLHFDEAFTGLTIHYAGSNECGVNIACQSPTNEQEILVDKDWALHAQPQDVSLELAQVHTDIAYHRIWQSDAAAEIFLNQIVPACAVLERSPLRDAAGVLPEGLNSSNASMLGMRDVVVAQLLDGNLAATVYPLELHSPVQVEAAKSISVAQLPEVVVSVSDPICQ